MNILVTGGAGYIGSHTCKLLARKGHAVFVYDNLSTGFRSLAKWGELIEGDTRDTARLRTVLKTRAIEGVIHFAAKSTVDEALKNPGEYFSNNMGGSLSLFEAMRDEGVRNVVVSGTAAVYGQPKTSPIPETAPTHPINPYGRSKLIMEQMLADFCAAHGMNGAVLRYFNAAGADPEGDTGEMHDPETHLIPRIIMALRGEISRLEVYGTDYDTPDGTCIRDYIHVSDLAAAHLSAMEHLAAGKGSVTLNLGSGTGQSVKEIIRAAEDATGKTVPVHYGPRRAGDPAELKADIAQARAMLCWRPEMSSAREIVESAWNWMQKNGR